MMMGINKSGIHKHIRGVDFFIMFIGKVLPDLHDPLARSGEHTSELQSPDNISYAVFCLFSPTVNVQT